MSVRSGTEVVSGPPETLYEMSRAPSTLLWQQCSAQRLPSSASHWLPSEAPPFRPIACQWVARASLVRPRSCEPLPSEGLGPEITKPPCPGLLWCCRWGSARRPSLVDIVVVVWSTVPTSRPASFISLSGFRSLPSVGHRDLFATEHARGKGHYNANHGDGGNHGGDDLVLVGLRLFDLVGAREPETALRAVF